MKYIGYNSACGGIACYGQALSETGGWYGDYQSMVSNTRPWFLRGARYSYSDSVNGGIFTFNIYAGATYYCVGVRAVLV